MKSTFLLPQFCIFATVGFFAMSMGTHAAALTWDITNAANNTITDGSGTWTTGAGNWNNGTISVNWTTGDTAAFNGAVGGTITVDAAGVSQGGMAFSGANNYTVSGGAIGGAGGLTKSGASIVTLSGANTYTGTTTVNGGTLKAGVASAVGSGAFGNNSAVVMGNVAGATLDLNGFNTQISNLTGGGTTGGTVAVGGSALTIGTSTANLGTVTYAGAFTGTGAGIINYTGSNATAFASGGNAITLSGANTGFTGQINLAGARVFVGTQAAAASAATLAGASATYNVGANGQVGFLNAVTYNNNVNINGNGWLETGNNTLGAIRLAGGATLAGNVTLNAAATIGGTTTGTISGIIADGTGTNAVTIVGTNTITFSGANTYAGNTSVSSGNVLKLDNNFALQNSAFDTASAGTVTFGTGVTTPTLGGLTGSTNLATKFTTGYTSVTSLTLNPLAGSQTYSGVIANGAMTLTKTGAGTQVLTNAANTYSGGTTVTAGTLGFSSGSLGTTGSISMNGGTLQWNTGNTQDISARLAMQTGKTATIDTNGNNVIFTNAIGSSTTGALTKTGTGTLTLTAASTYSGKTTISGGTLALSGAGTLGTTSEVALATGTLNVGGSLSVTKVTGSGTVIGALTVTTELAIGNSAGTISFDDLTVGSSSTSVFEVGGGAGDLANIADDLILGGTLDLNLLSGQSYVANQVYTLFGYTAGNLLSGTYKDGLGNTLLDGATFTDAGGIWKIDYDATITDIGLNGGAGNRFVTVTAVPEPAAALLGGLGLLALLRRRRN